MEARMTVCNMTIEAGGRAGLIATDDATFEWMHGRRYAPKGADWDAAPGEWRGLVSDPEARFAREVTIDGAEVAPTVTWGTRPETRSEEHPSDIQSLMSR